MIIPNSSTFHPLNVLYGNTILSNCGQTRKKKCALKVARVNLFAMLAFVSVNPCAFSRSANS